VRVGDRREGKGSLVLHYIARAFLRESLLIGYTDRATWLVRFSRGTDEWIEATPDGAEGTAERLTSHPEKESDMGTTDDTLKALNRLERTITGQRNLQLQAHGVLTCLYEVLLHAEGEEAVSYAQAAHVAASLINKSVEELDWVRLYQLFDVLAPPPNRVEEPRVLYVT